VKGRQFVLDSSIECRNGSLQLIDRLQMLSEQEPVIRARGILPSKATVLSP